MKKLFNKIREATGWSYLDYETQMSIVGVSIFTVGGILILLLVG